MYCVQMMTTQGWRSPWYEPLNEIILASTKDTFIPLSSGVIPNIHTQLQMNSTVEIDYPELSLCQIFTELLVHRQCGFLPRRKMRPILERTGKVGFGSKVDFEGRLGSGKEDRQVTVSMSTLRTAARVQCTL
ncbi:predicted protein [Sclerotinia sclerotiorum 1980 UF-70]|uniref:Uncharacterized protein n=1 Tax=Sclerotinia sclerotiorum (strain ATCC 18683 / 1980 / Ss-1) TaxID=665079 RepID=A7F2T2_SCLS1|nr:predicted protein [Sclerotinia sclerotiorum 1980 UF-70]EDN96024.1 predicted protein [Sclerotinia sclerotiorum 1980 UF-70]